MTDKAEFKFICACGCGTFSEVLSEKEYLRIYGNRKWYANKCLPKENIEIIKEIAGGKIVAEDDF